jgi:hypothetical protein
MNPTCIMLFSNAASCCIWFSSCRKAHDQSPNRHLRLLRKPTCIMLFSNAASCCIWFSQLQDGTCSVAN